MGRNNGETINFMQFITSPNKILGLDISELSLKVVQIRKNKGKKYIQAMNSINLPAGLIEEGVIKDHDKVARVVEKLIKTTPGNLTTKYAVVCLPEPTTFIKVIEVADKEIRAEGVEKVIMHELPRHMPLSMEEVQIDWQEIGAGNKKRKFLVGAVARSIADDYIKVCQLAGLKVAALEVEAQAITRSILPAVSVVKKEKSWLSKFNRTPKETKEENLANDNPKIILDMGATRTGLILMDHNTIQFTSSLAKISGEKITADILEQKKLSYNQAEKAKIICGINPRKCKGAVAEIIKTAIDGLLKEIINADNFYQDHFGQETHDIEIILSGGGAHLANIDKVLEEKIKRKVRIADALTNLEKFQPRKVNNMSAYTTAIGLALRNYI